MTVWIWTGLTLLVQLGCAQEPDRDRGAVFLQVWRFAEDGAGDSDFGRPQFLCSNASVSVRFSLIRHSDVRLKDGGSLLLLLLPDGCAGSVRTVRLWLLLELPFSCSHILTQASSRESCYRLPLRYFDHLLQKQMSATVTCRNPPAAQHPASPVMICHNQDIGVKLPPGSKLQSINVPGQTAGTGRLLSSTSSNGEQLHFTKTDDVSEIVYWDSTGERSLTLVACSHAAKGRGRGRRPRALMVNPVRSSRNQRFTTTTASNEAAKASMSARHPAETTATTAKAGVHRGSALSQNTSATDSKSMAGNIPIITTSSWITKEDLSTDVNDLASTTNNPTNSMDSTKSTDDQTNPSIKSTLTKPSTTKTMNISSLTNDFLTNKNIPGFPTTDPLKITLPTKSTILPSNQTNKTQSNGTTAPPTPTHTSTTEYLTEIPYRMSLTRPDARIITLRSIIFPSVHNTTNPTSRKHIQTAKQDVRTNGALNSTSAQPSTTLPMSPTESSSTLLKSLVTQRPKPITPEDVYVTPYQATTKVPSFPTGTITPPPNNASKGTETKHKTSIANSVSSYSLQSSTAEKSSGDKTANDTPSRTQCIVTTANDASSPTVIGTKVSTEDHKALSPTSEPLMSEKAITNKNIRSSRTPYKTTPIPIRTSEDQRTTNYNPATSVGTLKGMKVTAVTSADKNVTTESPSRFQDSIVPKYTNSPSDVLNSSFTHIKDANARSPTTDMKNTNATSRTISIVAPTLNLKENTVTSTSDMTAHTTSTAATEQHTSPSSTSDSTTITVNTLIPTKETPPFRDIKTNRETLLSTTKIPNRTTDQIRKFKPSNSFRKSLVQSESLFTTVKSLMTQPQSSTSSEFTTAVKLSFTPGSQDTAEKYVSISVPSFTTTGQTGTKVTADNLTTVPITNTTIVATFSPLTSSGDKINPSDISNKHVWTMATIKHPITSTAAPLTTPSAKTTETPGLSTPSLSTVTDKPIEDVNSSTVKSVQRNTLKAIHVDTKSTTPGSIHSTTLPFNPETNPGQIPNTSKGFSIPSFSGESGVSSSNAYISEPTRDYLALIKQLGTISSISFTTSASISADGSNTIAISAVPTTVSPFTPEHIQSTTSPSDRADTQNISTANNTTKDLPVGFTGTTITPYTSPITGDIPWASTTNSYDTKNTNAINAFSDGKTYTSRGPNDAPSDTPDHSVFSSSELSSLYITTTTTPANLVTSTLYRSESSSTIAPDESFISSVRPLSSTQSLSYGDQSFPVYHSTPDSPDGTRGTSPSVKPISSPDIRTITSGLASSADDQPIVVRPLKTLSTNINYSLTDADDTNTLESTADAVSTIDNPGTTAVLGSPENSVRSLIAPVTLTDTIDLTDTVAPKPNTPKRTVPNSAATLISASDPVSTEHITGETSSSRCATAPISDTSGSDTNCLDVRDNKPPSSLFDVIKLFYPNYPGPSYEPFRSFYPRLPGNSESKEICPFSECPMDSDSMDGMSCVPPPSCNREPGNHVNFQQPAPSDPHPAFPGYPGLPLPSFPQPSSLGNPPPRYAFPKIFNMLNKFKIPSSSNSEQPSSVYHRQLPSFHQNPSPPVFHNPHQPFLMKSRHSVSRPSHQDFSRPAHPVFSGLPNPGFSRPHRHHFAGTPHAASSGMSQNPFSGPPLPGFSRTPHHRFSGPPHVAVSQTSNHPFGNLAHLGFPRTPHFGPSRATISRTSHLPFTGLPHPGFSWSPHAAFSGRPRAPFAVPQRPARPPRPAFIRHSRQ